MAHRALKKVRDAVKGVYRGYMPIDLPQHRPPNRIKHWWKVLGKPRLTMYPKPEVDEYSEEPEYPPLNDATPEGLRRQVRLDWYESLKALPTAEQKLHEIGRHADHKMAHISNWPAICNALSFTQYLTQTHVINSLPPGYALHTPQVDGRAIDGRAVETQDQLELYDRVKQILLEQLVLDKYESEKIRKPPHISVSSRHEGRRAYVSKSLVQNIFNNLKKTLVYKTNPQLMDYQIDLGPSVRSWWYHSGFEPCDNKVFHKSRKDKDGHVNTMIQMDGSSALNVRCRHLMEPILSLDDPIVTDTSLVEKRNFNLWNQGAFYKFKRPVALPGFWLQDTPSYDSPHTCFLTADCLQLRQTKTVNMASQLDDTEQCLNSQAILTAFGWLNSLSMYHGFTPFQEIEYPFTCQVVTTNGQDWLFNVFQLNSHTFHRDLGGHKRNNVCWSSGLMKLYETYGSGTFKGVNDDVVKLLTCFMSKQTSPHYADQLKLRPYLGEDIRTPEEKEKLKFELRNHFEGRKNRWLLCQWKVPEYEHVFFRSKQARYQIRHMKPRWRPPRPVYPKIFE